MTAVIEAIAAGSEDWVAASDGCATRASRLAQLELARRDDRYFSVEGDLADCGGDWFKAAFPDRLIDVGIAEADLVGIAAGLSMRGKVPFVNTFASFALMRACEQVRIDVCYPRANVKIAGMFAGVAAGASGPTHHCIEDIAVARSFPNMVVLAPADVASAYFATLAAGKHPGPVYIRLGVEPTEQVYDHTYDFQIGKGTVLREGEDVAIVAAGLSSVANALSASRVLAAAGVSALVVDMATIKPIDRALLEEVAVRTGRIVTVEEHSILGGLGGAVAEVVAEVCPVPMLRVGLPDSYCSEINTYCGQLQRYGLDTDGIVSAVQTILKRRR